ncbi:MAG: hypothetical protein ABW212_08545, partial [Pseudonocardia sediminis]
YKSGHGATETETHGFGHEKGFDPATPSEAFRFPTRYEVQIGGRWSAPANPVQWPGAPARSGDGNPAAAPATTTVIDGHVEVTAPQERGTPLSEPAARRGSGWQTDPTADSGRRPGDLESGMEMAPPREHARPGHLVPGAELESLRLPTDLTGRAAEMLQAPRWQRWRNWLSWPFTGSTPAAIDEHSGKHPVGSRDRLGDQPDERTAAIDVLEAFTSPDARAARFERTVNHQDTVRLRTDNTGGVFGGRDIEAQLDLSTRLGQPGLTHFDPAHTFTRIDHTTSEHQTSANGMDGVKAKTNFTSVHTVRSPLSMMPVLEASAKYNVTKAEESGSAAKHTTTVTTTEPAYLVSFDAIDTLRSSPAHHWQDWFGLRHGTHSPPTTSWISTPDAVRMWVPASEIGNVGQLTPEDVARLAPEDRARYQQAHPETATVATSSSGPSSRPGDPAVGDPDAITPDPVDPAAVRPPADVGHGLGQVELHRPQDAKKLIDDIRQALDGWSSAHGRPSWHARAIQVVWEALGKPSWMPVVTVPALHSGTTRFDGIHQELVDRVLGPFTDPRGARGVPTEMLNGGRPLFLHANTPYGTLEQLVVLRAEMGDGTYHRNVANHSSTDAIESTSSQGKSVKKAFAFSSVVGVGLVQGASGKPGSVQILGAGVDLKVERGSSSSESPKITVTSKSSGPATQFVHDMTVHMDVYPYAKPGTYTKLVPSWLPFSPHAITEPWTASFDLPGSLRSTVADSDVIRPGAAPVAPLETVRGSGHGGWSQEAKVQVKPFEAPLLQRALRQLEDGDRPRPGVEGGDRPRPGLQPQGRHRLQTAFGLDQRLTHLQDAAGGGHRVPFAHGPISAVTVSADLTERSLIGPIDEGSLKTDGSTTKKAEITSGREASAVVATSFDFRAPAIEDTQYRPTQGMADIQTGPWSQKSSEKSGVSTESKTPESTAEKRYRVRVTPRWTVTPEFREPGFFGSDVPAAWKRPLVTGADTPIVLEVDARGLADLGLHDPADPTTGKGKGKEPLPPIPEAGEGSSRGDTSQAEQARKDREAQEA